MVLEERVLSLYKEIIALFGFPGQMFVGKTTSDTLSMDMNPMEWTVQTET